MQTLTLNKKTGFFNLNPKQDILIRDFRGKVFYDTTGLENVVKFNLPKGKYTVQEGEITFAPSPRKYKLSVLPHKERNYPSPSNFNIKFAPNPNKCTISWNKKLITFDTSLKDEPLAVLMFMLFHEFGHKFYSTEKYADLFSANMMKKEGYNPSQIGEAQILSLSDRQLHRKHFITNNLIKTA